MNHQDAIIEQSAFQEAQLVIKLQEWLINISPASLPQIAHDLLLSVFVQDQDRIFQLLWNIINSVSIRPKNIQLYVNLIVELDSHSNEISTLSLIRPLIVRMLLTPKPFIEQFLSNVGDFLFLRRLIKALNMTTTDVVAQLRHFCEMHEDLKYYHCLIFAIFAPEIQIADTQLFSTLRNLFYEEWAAPSCKPVLKDFFDNITNLNRNNWRLLQECYLSGGYPESINVAIKTDNINLFQELSNSPNFSLDHHIRPSVFESCHFVQSEPSLIQYAAFYGSLRIFKFLLLNGSDLNQEDANGSTLAQFVVAGGNVEMVRICQQRKCDFSGCLQIATRFYRFDIFDWLHFAYLNDLTEVHPKFGNVFHESAASNNVRQIIYCIDNTLDVDSRSSDKSTPLHYAVKNRAADSIRLLLSINSLDVNAKDSTGMTPLHTAALFEESRMVVELLNCNRIDVNSVNRWGMTPLHIAAQDGNTQTVSELIKRPEIDVNCKDENFMTPLHYAAQEGEFETVRILLTAKDIDINCEDAQGLIPFSYAEASGMEEITQLLQDWVNT
ncbi:hypothetical protein TVAG_136540 [Trichomonas vaginalis G3]|uniref:Uncharacterized protein n=1 Tax=Trichomonas vaginalis (strain ATCC PRA-98 / G3) TaxID=412133 RepID=A2DJD6_TRIV3|nr:spectrin binding [Trichomonas vaginalis G3]EAY19523.1 hypothetical protein TVAG_136540 [Trichomonas vaginalis G3]KAI5519995.1 spectrin binding [Trichomonas vaginalis G3]|eukprot:XP_001580509.1 hypothetical protein [Trichomonas vaginalis G3]